MGGTRPDIDKLLFFKEEKNKISCWNCMRPCKKYGKEIDELIDCNPMNIIDHYKEFIKFKSISLDWSEE